MDKATRLGREERDERKNALKQATDYRLWLTESNWGMAVSVVTPSTVTIRSEAELESIQTAGRGSLENFGTESLV